MLRRPRTREGSALLVRAIILLLAILLLLLLLAILLALLTALLLLAILLVLLTALLLLTILALLLLAISVVVLLICHVWPPVLLVFGSVALTQINNASPFGTVPAAIRAPSIPGVDTNAVGGVARHAERQPT